jgi:hypothetical protein
LLVSRSSIFKVFIIKSPKLVTSSGGVGFNMANTEVLTHITIAGAVPVLSSVFQSLHMSMFFNANKIHSAA